MSEVTNTNNSATVFQGWFLEGKDEEVTSGDLVGFMAKLAAHFAKSYSKSQKSWQNMLKAQFTCGMQSAIMVEIAEKATATGQIFSAGADIAGAGMSAGFMANGAAKAGSLLKKINANKTALKNLNSAKPIEPAAGGVNRATVEPVTNAPVERMEISSAGGPPGESKPTTATKAEAGDTSRTKEDILNENKELEGELSRAVNNNALKGQLAQTSSSALGKIADSSFKTCAAEASKIRTELDSLSALVRELGEGVNKMSGKIGEQVNDFWKAVDQIMEQVKASAMRG